MSESPIRHCRNDRAERVPQFGQAVFRLRRDHGVLAARDQPPPFQFPEFFGQDSVADGRAGPAQRRKPLRFIPYESPDDPGFPFAAKNA